MIKHIKCPVCGAVMTAGLKCCPHSGCGINIENEILSLEKIFKSNELPLDEKEKIESKLKELAPYYTINKKTNAESNNKTIVAHQEKDTWKNTFNK